ncbi:MAG: Response regulator of zinc sigma-54-dependent two-component system [Nitrospira sp.]|nr:Response regulator of zinc sigma-54-dependent two-component system [Nitrospira sp.]
MSARSKELRDIASAEMDTQATNRDVLVADWNQERLQRITELLRASCCVEPIHKCDHVIHAVRRLAPSVVILPLRWLPAECTCSLKMCSWDRVLDAVIGLPQPPMTVVFAKPLPDLPLSNCRLPFLKGATALLDESDPNFFYELRAIVTIGLKRTGATEGSESFPEHLALVGSSAAIQDLRDHVRKAATLSDVPVLITGESGTGKEVVARAIHHLDAKRANSPFIPVNCSAISSTLAESELFGHKRGAFTGANADRQGFFRAAHGGVLFLDEISELDQHLQPKLLRALQEGSVRPVGDEYEQKIDIRVIAATNKDLSAQVARGAFRMDLYQRLDVLSVRVPSLRTHKEDIGSLVRFFVKKHASCYAGTIRDIDSRVLEMLTTLDYEGNVRELENLVRKILFRKEAGDTLDLADLPIELFTRTGCASSSDSLDAVAVALLERIKQGMSCAEALAECERLLLRLALQESRGCRSKMATLLKLSPRTLFNRLRAFGL